MAKAQGKKASAVKKSPAKKAAAAVKKAVSTAKKKVAPKKSSAPAKPAKKAAPAKAKVAPKSKVAAKKVKVVAKKVVKAAKAAVKAVKAAPKAAAKPAPKSAAKVAAAKPPAKASAKPADKPAAKPAKAAPKVELKPAAVPPTPPKGPVAPKVPPVPKIVPKVAPKVVDDKKRTRRPRLRLTSGGAPAAAWLSTEKPRPASFIPAPPRAEAPSAIAAPPASSDRLIRPEEVIELMVRTVPVRVDIEQGAGRFYVIANPQEVVLRPGEGIEWDFRYIGGADVNVDDVVIEFEKPAPFAQVTFKTRKTGGARPHRQLSGPVNAAAVGKRASYVIRAMSQFKTELANARMYVSVIASAPPSAS